MTPREPNRSAPAKPDGGSTPEDAEIVGDRPRPPHIEHAGDATTGVVSPPCSLHEVDPAYAGLDFPSSAGDWEAVRRWRVGRRKALRAARLNLSPRERAARSARIAEALTAIVTARAFELVAAYWPLRGEPDLRPWMRARAAAAMGLALPVIVERGAPLEFRRWAPGEPLVRGVWDIPAPAAGDPVVPDAVIAPLVGFDRARYRLGNGGGYFDRTLAAMRPRPFVIGVGFADGELPSIFPQAHDVAMDVIVTERGIVD